MKKTILFLACLSFVGCSSFDHSVNQAKMHCNNLMNSTRMPQTNSDKWNKRTHVNCVAEMTNASENKRAADILMVQLIVALTSIGLTIVGLIAAAAAGG